MARKTRKPTEKADAKQKQISVFLPLNVAEALMAYASEKRWSTSLAAAVFIETGLASTSRATA